MYMYTRLKIAHLDNIYNKNMFLNRKLNSDFFFSFHMDLMICQAINHAFDVQTPWKNTLQFVSQTHDISILERF